MLHSAGIDFEVTVKSSAEPPVVLLHGSNGRETDWTDFAECVAPSSTCFAVRGPIASEHGFTFFRRNPDRSLNIEELTHGAASLCAFIDAISREYDLARAPIIAGYSSGAVIAAAVVCRQRALTSGAILLRPQSPDPQTPFPDLKEYPVLILAGANDDRRDRCDAPVIAEQFHVAGADLTYRLLDAGHGWEPTGLDRSLSRQWFQNQFPTSSNPMSIRGDHA
ncbi:alpha/beta hydrolase [Sinorhizobium garamanticum]|uniref:Alpha/beta hydrolase n=1 Tax=Sinorhizobium garamanticum TaxID=680247 RepID=A0ABY8D610_9HYPH|nr:alpha/beta hydrolase [Sinorhizobium garamanticum]WEX86300.1 alpha/beta hydrolase [Sinorhizobium garamanticum]